jgi:hypothetical protein
MKEIPHCNDMVGRSRTEQNRACAENHACSKTISFAGQMQAANALYVLANVLQLNPGLEAVA